MPSVIYLIFSDDQLESPKEESEHCQYQFMSIESNITIRQDTANITL